MTHNDIYTKFMIEYDKANVTSSYPALTKYEVATLLDRAYLTLIARKLTGNNTRRVPFEYDTKAIEDLRPLVVTSKFNSATDITTVSNEYTFSLPSDLMYYLEGVAEFGAEREVVQPINHQLARKFKATNSNIPWINNPVSYIEGSSIHVFIDPFEHTEGPLFDGTYIKKPASFVASLTYTDDTPNTPDNPDTPPDTPDTPETIDTPIISGTTPFEEYTTITIVTATQGAIIKYTTDNSIPVSNWVTYTSPFTITETSTIWAFATKNGNSSATVSDTFVKEEPTVNYAITIEKINETFNKCIIKYNAVVGNLSNFIIVIKISSNGSKDSITFDVSSGEFTVLKGVANKQVQAFLYDKDSNLLKESNILKISLKEVEDEDDKIYSINAYITERTERSVRVKYEITPDTITDFTVYLYRKNTIDPTALWTLIETFNNVSGNPNFDREINEYDLRYGLYDTNKSAIIDWSEVITVPSITDSGSGGGNNDPSQPSYVYNAPSMLLPGQNPKVLHYTGTVYKPTTNTILEAGALLAPRGVSDDTDAWFVYSMYDNSQPNIVSSAGTLRVKTEDLTDIDPRLYTWFRNTEFYNQQEPGKYLGSDYIFDCSSEIYDTNYGIQCYMSNDNGWLNAGPNINIATPTRVPTMYQIYNDPDVYGGYYSHSDNYIMGVSDGSSYPIIESASTSGTFAGDILINNAVAVRSTFKYGGSNCIKDSTSKWNIEKTYVNPDFKPYDGNSMPSPGYDGYYKLKLADSYNSKWEDNGIDTYTRVLFKAITAQHDFALGLIIGVIRDNDNHDKWTALGVKENVKDVVQDSLDNDYDPRMRFIWQIRNKISFLRVLQQIVNDLHFGSYTDKDKITIYGKPTDSSNAQFSRLKIKDVLIDKVAESLLCFFGPKMPWEGKLDNKGNDWECSVNLDNNTLSKALELYSGVYDSQTYESYRRWWDNKVETEFGGNVDNIGDTINFIGTGWTNLDNKHVIKSETQNSSGTKSAVRRSMKDKLKQVLNRALGGEDISNYAINNYSYALLAGYKKITPSAWNYIVEDTLRDGEDTLRDGIEEKTTWTMEKFRYCVYYKKGNKYQFVYTCAEEVQGIPSIRFFIFNNPKDVHEGEFVRKGRMSDAWIESIKYWKDKERTYLEDFENCYVKRFYDEDGLCSEDGAIFDTSEWNDVESLSFKVLKFIDTYGQTNTLMLSKSYMFVSPFSYSNQGGIPSDELINATNAGWADIFVKGPVGSGDNSHIYLNRIYGYIIEGMDSNGSEDDDKVSVGIVSDPGIISDYNNIANLQDAAYSWALLLVILTKNLSSFSTSPLVDEISSYLNLNRELAKLSIAYYDEHPTEKTNLPNEYLIYLKFGQVQDVYFGRNDKYIFNTVRRSISGDNDIMTRLSKAYTTVDWNSWHDLKNLFFVEGPCNEGQGFWNYKTGLRVEDMPGMTLRKGDILVILRNNATINNHIVGDIWLNNESAAYGVENHIVLSDKMENDPFSKLDLADIGTEIINHENVLIDYQEVIDIPAGMPDSNTIPDNPRKYGRFGGNFTFGALKVDNETVISRLALNTLYAYSYYQDFNMIYGTAKVNYRGEKLDRLDNTPGLY